MDRVVAGWILRSAAPSLSVRIVCSAAGEATKTGKQQQEES